MNTLSHRTFCSPTPGLYGTSAGAHDHNYASVTTPALHLEHACRCIFDDHAVTGDYACSDRLATPWQHVAGPTAAAHRNFHHYTRHDFM